MLDMKMFGAWMFVVAALFALFGIMLWRRRNMVGRPRKEQKPSSMGLNIVEADAQKTQAPLPAPVPAQESVASLKEESQPVEEVESPPPMDQLGTLLSSVATGKAREVEVFVAILSELREIKTLLGAVGVDPAVAEKERKKAALKAELARLG